MHRFILVGTDVSSDRIVVSDREAVHQMRNVFRLGEGDAFVACDGKGTDAVLEIERASLSSVEARVRERRSSVGEPSVRVTLYCSVLKREHFELVVQKATECGVAAIVPIVSARTVRLGTRADRLEKIAREAAEQCGRGVVPGILEPMSLREAVEHARGNAANIFFEPGMPAFDAAAIGASASAGLFIGPEGGWEPDEVAALRAAGFHAAGLGPRILRAETAAIVAVFLAAGGR